MRGLPLHAILKYLILEDPTVLVLSGGEVFMVKFLNNIFESYSGSCGGYRYLHVVKSFLIPLGKLSCGISVKIPTRILVFPTCTGLELLHLPDI